MTSEGQKLILNKMNEVRQEINELTNQRTRLDAQIKKGEERITLLEADYNAVGGSTIKAKNECVDYEIRIPSDEFKTLATPRQKHRVEVSFDEYDRIIRKLPGKVRISEATNHLINNLTGRYVIGKTVSLEQDDELEGLTNRFFVWVTDLIQQEGLAK